VASSPRDPVHHHHPQYHYSISLPPSLLPDKRHSSSSIKATVYFSSVLFILNLTFFQGTQNYTCNTTTGTYSTSGTAEAKLLDVTQFYTGSSLPSSQGPIQLLNVAGSHYYVPDPLAPTSIVPKFEDCTGFFIGTKNATVANSVPSYSVASVLLKNVQSGKAGGSLADWVVRTDVVGGVTPTALDTCVAGDSIAVPYKAHYLFFKNS
jgi:hypothetical protein